MSRNIDINSIIKKTHDTAGTAVAYIAPLLAPLPAALAVWEATGEPVTAVVFEGLGFAAVRAGLWTSRSNQVPDGRRAPMSVAIALFVIYFVTIMAILLSAKTLPVWGEWQAGAVPLWKFLYAITPSLYPLLTIVGAGVFALVETLQAYEDERKEEKSSAESAAAQADAQDQALREQEIEQQRLDREMKREQTRLDAEAKRENQRLRLESKLSQAVAPNTSQVSQVATPTTGETPSADDTWRLIETFVRQNPTAGLRRIGNAAGVSKDTADRQLKAAGYSKNGNGWARQ